MNFKKIGLNCTFHSSSLYSSSHLRDLSQKRWNCILSLQECAEISKHTNLPYRLRFLRDLWVGEPEGAQVGVLQSAQEGRLSIALESREPMFNVSALAAATPSIASVSSVASPSEQHGLSTSVGVGVNDTTSRTGDGGAASSASSASAAPQQQSQSALHNK